MKLGEIIFLSVFLFGKKNSIFAFNDCPSLEIRSLKQFNLLENCTSIVGDLHIVLTFEPERSINVTFPNLREITGYLMIAEFHNLESVGDLFPNLIVIRGQTLFLNYALILYRLPNLSNIGLENLIEVSRGSVRVDHCPKLCFTKTVDWKSVMKHGHFVYNDKNQKNKNCTPSYMACPDCNYHYCWSGNKCQKFKDMFYYNSSCHWNCFVGGGCFGSTNAQCFACQQYLENEFCVDKCSNKTILNTDTLRCIDLNECQRLNRKIFENKCVSECPSGYSVKGDLNLYTQHNISSGNVCGKCESRCPKVCPVNDVLRSMSQLQKFEGCTILNGSLEIYILDDLPHINQELNKYLGDIEEIWGILKIHRSTPLTSLDFLNRLKLIQGNKNHNFSLYVYENQNLQKLFDWTKREKPVIAYGYVQFHNNKMLCQREVDEFQRYALHNFTEHDLIESNGFHRFCINDYIQTNYQVWSSDSIGVFWKDYKYQGISPSYIIYYVNSTLTEVLPNHFHERESCSAYSWKSIYINRENLISWDSEYLIYNLTYLEPFTQYAFFIQTYVEETASSEIQNTRLGQSKVMFARTKHDEPSRVINLISIGKTQNSITLKWDVVGQENEIISHFFVDVIAQPESNAILDQRNYCQDPIRDHLSIENELYYQEDEFIDQNCCQYCDYEFSEDTIFKSNVVDADLQKLKEKSKFESEEFSKFIYNKILFTSNAEQVYRSARQEYILKIPQVKNYIGRIPIPKDRRNFTIGLLKPFIAYNFLFYTCANDSSNNLKEVCSTYVLYSNRTTMNPEYDSVEVFGSLSEDQNSFELFFMEPEMKNGAIINYLIEYKHLGVFDDDPKVECITRKQHELSKYIYILIDLKPGVYSVTVRAVSIAGPGPVSNEIIFNIPEKEDSEPTYSVWIILMLILIIILLAILAFTYYNRYKIRMAFQRNGEGLHLVSNEELPKCSMTSSQNWTAEFNDNYNYN